jgi:opacity protein-like surface antigen
MARTRFGLAILLAMTLLGASAFAQKLELGASIGRVFVSDQGVLGANPANPNLHFGDGLSYEVSVGRHLLDLGIVGITAEVPVVFTPEAKLNFGVNVVPKSYRSFYVTPAARLNLFPDTRFSPWVSFGGGFAHFSESSELEFGGPNPGPTGTTSGVFQSGGGLDVRLTSGLKLRGEFRDFYSGVPQLNVNTGKDHQHNMFVGGGVVFTF